MQILYSYFRYTGRLFFGCALFVARCNIIRASWETKNKQRLSHRKKYIEEFVWAKSLFWLHTLLSMSLSVAFFVYSLPLPKWCTGKGEGIDAGWYSVWWYHDIQHRRFLVNIAKFLRTPILKNILNSCFCWWNRINWSVKIDINVYYCWRNLSFNVANTHVKFEKFSKI